MRAWVPLEGPPTCYKKKYGWSPNPNLARVIQTARSRRTSKLGWPLFAISYHSNLLSSIKHITTQPIGQVEYRHVVPTTDSFNPMPSTRQTHSIMFIEIYRLTLILTHMLSLIVIVTGLMSYNVPHCITCSNRS